MKKFLAKVLLLALLLTMSDFSVLTAEAATDGYRAYDVLISNRNTLSNYNMLTGVCNMLQTANSNPRNNLTNVIYEVWNKTGSSTTDGLYHLQLTSAAYAQIKSGAYTGESNYEAMSGTPTTEDLFINVGGTPWLVDITYRIVRLKYARNYNFKVNDTANYRYYKTDEPTTVSAPSVANFNSIAFELEANKDPKPYMEAYHMDGSDLLGGIVGSGGTVFYSPTWDALQRGFIVDTSLPAYIDNFDTLVNGMPGSLSGGISSDRDWFQIKMNINGSAPEQKGGPGYQLAADFKWIVGQAYKQLQEAWDTQDDNYRADSGYDRTDYIEYSTGDGGEYRFYDATWEYTYGWMARHSSQPRNYTAPSAINGGHAPNSIAVGGGNNSILNCSGTCQLEHHKSVWNPIWVSVHCDDNMIDTSSGGESSSSILKESSSAIPNIPTFGDTGVGGNPTEYMRSLYVDAGSGYTKDSDVFGVRDVWSLDSTPSSDPNNGHHLLNRAMYGSNPFQIFTEMALASTATSLLENPNIYSPTYVFADMASYNRSWSPYYLSIAGTQGPNNQMDTSNQYMATRQLIKWAFADANNNDNRDSLFEALGISDWKDYYNDYYTLYMKTFTSAMPAPNIANWQNTHVAGSNSHSDSKLITSHYTKTSIEALKSVGWSSDAIAIEGPILFYSKAYQWMNFVGPFLYWDEFKEVFGQFPGIDMSAVSQSEWDKATAYNLALVFGSPNGLELAKKSGKTVFHFGSQAVNIGCTLPLACFPAGGDMDGSMRASWSSFAVEYPKYFGIDTNLVHPAQAAIFNPALCPSYVYWMGSQVFRISSNSLSVERLILKEDRYVTKYAYTGDPTHHHSKADACSCEVSNKMQISATETLLAVCQDTPTIATKSWVCTDVTSCSCILNAANGYQHDSGCPLGNCSGNCVAQYADYDTHYMGVLDHSFVQYKSEYSCTFSVSFCVSSGFPDADSNLKSWVTTNKVMKYNTSFQQMFENIEYVDIVSMTIWQWSQAEVAGLSGLLARPLSTDNVNHGNIRNYDASGDVPTLITNAVRSLGFDVYNVDDSNLKGTPSIIEDGGTYYTVYSEVQRNLEVKGRVANSYNPMSSSNDFNDWEVLVTKGTSDELMADYQVYSTSANALMRRECTVRTSDAPVIQNSQRGVNNDDHAFVVMHSNGTMGYWNITDTDDLYFSYDPYSQGGTSSSNFPGFVLQALARTLSYYDMDTSCAEGASLLSDDPDRYSHLHPYSNSLLVQGDYVVLHLPDGSTLPLVGSYYDTWQEKDSNSPHSDASNTGGKFSLGFANAGMPVLFWRYNSLAHPWVAGDVNYILTRSYSAGRAISYVNGTNFTQNSWVHNYSCGINSNIGTTNDENMFLWTQGSGNHAAMTNLSAYNASGGMTAIGYTTAANTEVNTRIFNTQQSKYGTNHTFYVVNSGLNFPSTVDPITVGGTYPLMSYLDGGATVYLNATANYSYSTITSDLQSISGDNSHLGFVSEPGDGSVSYTTGNTLSVYFERMTIANARFTQVFDEGAVSGGEAAPSLLYNGCYARNVVTLNPGSVKHGMNTATVFTNESIINNPIVGFQEGYSSTKPISFVLAAEYQKGLSGGRGGILFDETKTFVSDILKHWRSLGSYYGDDPEYADIKTFTKFGVLMHVGGSGARNNAIRNAYINSAISIPSGSVLSAPNRNTSSSVSVDSTSRVGTYYRNDITNWGDVHPSAYYPWMSDLNVKRFLGNQTWDTGTIGIRYTLAYNKQDGSHTADASDVSANSRWQIWNPTSGDGHIIEAKYTAPGSAHVNDIVIYNPVTSESALIKKLSDYMPDGSNYGNNPEESFTGGLYGTSYTKWFSATAVMWAVVRDQRTARVALNDKSNPETITNGTIRFSSATQTTSRVEWYMRAVSLAITRAYTWSDYEVTEEKSEVEIIDRLDTENHSVRITETGLYRMVNVDTTNQIISTTVSLKAGDTVYWSDTGTEVWVQNGASVVEQTFQTFVDAANSLLTEDDEYHFVLESEYVSFPQGSTVNLLAATIDMTKGSYITLTLDLYDENMNPLPWDLLSYWHYNTAALQVHEEINGATHTLHIEALQDTTLNGLTIENLIQEVRVGHFEGSSIVAKDILLVSIGNNNKPVTQTTTITYLYGSEEWSQSSVTRTSSYNKTVVEISGEWHIEGIETYEARYCYLQSLKNTFTIELKDDAIGPHNVPNTLWKYYVLGWSTTDHSVILDVNDERLNEGSSTVLVTPAGVTVAVSEIYQYVSEGRLYIANVNGEYRLVIRNASETSELPTVFPWYGIEMTIEDARKLIQTVHFGQDCVWYGNTISVSVTDRTDVVTHYFYEVFQATLIEGYAYEVKYSQNLQHKYAAGTVQSLYELDWEEREITVIVGESVDAYGNANSTFSVSLDDEFTIYWDNNGNLFDRDPDYIVTTDGYASIQAKPGKGYDTSLMTPTITQYSGHYNKYVTDTTKWIRNKYLTFNVDVYAFTESIPSSVGSGNMIDLSTVSYANYNSTNCSWFNPTTPAYKANGEPNKVVYIPAGTRVYLGQYDNAGTNGDNQDNAGRFTDFGGAGTKDPNGEQYVYHFWLPLGVGELDDEANVQMHVQGINGSEFINGNLTPDKDDTGWTVVRMNQVTGMGAANQYQYLAAPTIFGLQRYIDSKSKNEWGELVVVAGGYRHVNNVDAILAWCMDRDPNAECYESITVNTAESTLRDENSENNITFSIYGRIGGITVVDTTDPAYSDSFKMVDVADPEWYITKYIRKITNYDSSKITDLITNGHQFVYKSDVTDVRGRGAAVSQYHNWQGVNFNTYTTQFHKRYMYSSTVQNTWKYTHQLIRFGMSTWATDLFVHGTDPDLINYTPRVSPIGTEVFCSLETIGNYFGSVSKRQTTGSTEFVNGNGDYGQTKVQLQILYTDADGNPLDVYLKQNGKYYLINAGSAFVAESDARTYYEKVGGTFDSGPYISDAVYNAYSETTIITNSTVDWRISASHGLDQHMQRLYVTHEESSTTRYVMHYAESHGGSWSKRITSTILEPFGYNPSEIGSSFMQYIYSYGTSEMLFMREYNRTFIGGSTSALNYYDADTDIAQIFAPMYGQKWYFSIKLPTNVVFVPHGTKITGYYETSYQYEVVISWIKAFALGDKWIIRYESESQDFNEDPEDDSGVLKIKLPQPETDPTPIPVYVFRPDKNANFSDRGTY